MNKAPCFLPSFNKYLSDCYVTDTMLSAIERVPFLVELMI